MSHRAAWGVVLGAVVVAATVIGGTRLSAPLAPEAVHAQGNLKYTGAASCGASNCHGSTKPKADFPKLNENVVWFQKDKHAKAYATLTNECRPPIGRAPPRSMRRPHLRRTSRTGRLCRVE